MREIVAAQQFFHNFPTVPEYVPAIIFLKTQSAVI